MDKVSPDVVVCFLLNHKHMERVGAVSMPLNGKASFALVVFSDL